MLTLSECCMSDENDNMIAAWMECKDSASCYAIICTERKDDTHENTML